MAEEDEDESPHMDMDETDEEAQDIGPAFDDDLDSDVIDVIIEEDDCVFMMMVHPVDPHHFVHASSTVSGRLAEASAKNSNRRVLRILCRRLYTNMPTSLVKPPSTRSRSAANGTTPSSWSTSPHLDSGRSTR
jgi:hypothetical protein